MHYLPHARADCCKPRQSQQAQGRRLEASRDAFAIASVAMGVLMELGVADPVPPLDAPPVSLQLQQFFWACAVAAEKEVYGVERLPSRVPVVTTSTIQIVPRQTGRMCSGASFARGVQVMSRP